MFSRRIQFWTLLAPFLSLITLLLWVIKGEGDQFYLSLGLILGMPLIWRFRFWGCAFVSLMMIGVITWAYLEVPIEERFWIVGIGISQLLTLGIFALSLKEVSELTRQVEESGKKHLARAVNLDDELQQLRKRIKAERKAWEDQLRWQQELTDTARRDFLKVNKQKEKLENKI